MVQAISRVFCWSLVLAAFVMAEAVAGVPAKTKAEKSQTSVPAASTKSPKPTKRSKPATTKSPRQSAAKQRQRENVPSAQPAVRSRKSGHRAKRNKRPAVVEPTEDHSYLGVVRRPYRYNPHSAGHMGVPAAVHSRDLIHDHFQELDKNRDGVIDPMEHAAGRLDMDRDSPRRGWK